MLKYITVQKVLLFYKKHLRQYNGYMSKHRSMFLVHSQGTEHSQSKTDKKRNNVKMKTYDIGLSFLRTIYCQYNQHTRKSMLYFCFNGILKTSWWGDDGFWLLLYRVSPHGGLYHNTMSWIKDHVMFVMKHMLVLDSFHEVKVLFNAISGNIPF